MVEVEPRQKPYQHDTWTVSVCLCLCVCSWTCVDVCAAFVSAHCVGVGGVNTSSVHTYKHLQYGRYAGDALAVGDEGNGLVCKHGI